MRAGKKLNKKDLLSTNIATKKGYCTQLVYICNKTISKMPKPIDLQYTYKKLIGFTKTQKLAFEKLEKYDVNVSQFIRQAIKEKLKRV